MTNDATARKAQTQATFDLLARDYDAAGCFAHFGQRLVDEVGVEPGAYVLDVASGRGAVLFPAAKRAGPTGMVVGVDLAPEMARAVNDEGRRLGFGTPVRVMDAEHLDFAAGTFDVVLCGFGLMFFPDQDRALGEIRRVLKGGGKLGVSTWQVSQGRDLGALLEEMGLRGTTEPGWIDDADHLARLLARAGFVDVRVTVDSHVFCYPDLEHYWQNARSTGFRRRLDGLNAEQTERVRAALDVRLREHQHQDGIHLKATALLAVGQRAADRHEEPADGQC